MCGIAGYVDFQSPTPRCDVLDHMAASLRRRGPDAQGTKIDGSAGFAHARLSVIDIHGSTQPMTVPSSDVTLVYNGELYNYIELRDSLTERGDKFATSGDTEVILRAVARDWDRAPAQFNGMFAFAAWDRKREKMLLARDLMGEKPLFYAMPRPNLLVYGSEPKALLQHPDVEANLDMEALRQALRFRAVYGEACLNSGITQLKPGHYLEFGRDGVRTAPYRDLLDDIGTSRIAWSKSKQKTLIEAGLDQFMKSVKERLVGDVPVGAFLSGGLDSSLIVAAIRKLRSPQEEICTFSVGFSGDPHSELSFAQVVADAIGTNHTPITVGPDSFISRMAELSACRDGPVSQPADVAIAEMSRIARQSVTVALSGEGADEVFGGYPKYAFAGAPKILRIATQLAGPQKAAWIAGRLGMNETRALVAARALACPNPVEAAAQWFSYFDRRDLKSLLPLLGWSDDDWAHTIGAHADAATRASECNPLLQMQAIDCLTWLPGNMLERGDRMTMAEGLEVRAPFLDPELVAFGLSLPDNMKIRGRTNKWIVRQWAAELLPTSIASRKKWGFRVPLDDWFRGPLRDMLFAYLTSNRGLCGTYGDRSAIGRLLENHDQGVVDASNSLWTLLSAEVWYQDVHLKSSLEIDQHQSISAYRNANS